ncbi:MAG: hypothetical protein Q8898_11185 [Bacillota bacterium]|nr:hypothetical protein [Bacillota bacterium]
MAKLYTFNLEREKNTFFVKVSGHFKEEDAKAYLSEFQTIVNTINPSNYKLIIDGSEQEAVPSHVVEDLRFVLRLYSMANFKKIVIVSPTSAASKMQVNNCAKDINFQGTFVNTVEEAYHV